MGTSVRMSRGHKRAFEALVRRCHGRVYAAAFRILGNGADAEDVTQQCYAGSLGDAEGLLAREDPCGRLAWLASRLALNLLRDAKVRKRNEEEYAMWKEKQSRETSGVDPEDAVVLAEELRALPEELRLALVLRYQEGLSLAGAGELLGCAESTVHDRIARGLSRLKARLRGRGVALGGLALPEWLAATKEAVVPAGLQGKLLGLAGGPALGASLLLKPIVLLPLGLVVVSLGSFALLRNPSPRVSQGIEKAAPILATQDPSKGVEKGEAPSRPQARRRLAIPAKHSPKPGNSLPRETATLQGLVRDQGGRPLEGVEVSANSLAFKGKFPLFSRSVRSLWDGSFAIQVPIQGDKGLRYQLSARLRGYRPAQSKPLWLRAKERKQVFPLVLEKRSREQPGTYKLRVQVVDRSGRGFAKVRLRLLRELPGASGPRRIQEAVGATDPKGLCILPGSYLGDKRLIVDGRPEGGRRLVLNFAIRKPGEHRRMLHLLPGLTIQGRAIGLQGGPIAGIPIRAQKPGDWEGSTTSWTDAKGRFLLKGLDEGPYRIAFHQSVKGYSPFTLDGIEAGTQNLILRLKPRTSPRDIGLHDGEIHGRFVDAKTRKELRLSSMDWELHRIPAAVTDRVQWLRDLHAKLVHPWPVQTEFMGMLSKPSPHFRFLGLEPGWYAVSANLPGKAVALSAPIQIVDKRIVAGLILPLEEGGEVQGVVRDPEGRVLPRTWVLVLGSWSGGRARSKVFDAMVTEPGDRLVAIWGLRGGKPSATDSKGRFRLKALPTGIPFSLTAFHPEFAPVRIEGLVLREGEHKKGLELRFTKRR